MNKRVVSSAIMISGAVAAVVIVALGKRKRSESPTVVLDEQTIYGDVPEAEAFDLSMQRRNAVVAMARTQLGATSAEPYWAEVLGYAPSQSLPWCGAFALWALRRALGIDWRWVPGRGFIYVDNEGLPLARPRLPIVSRPQAGDVAYYDQPYQHHAIVAEVQGDRVLLVAGNTPNVSEYTEPLSKATAYYSIAPIVGG